MDKTKTLIANENPLVIQDVHTADYLEFIRQIGFIPAKELRPLLFKFDPETVESLKLKYLLIAGKGRMYGLEGDLLTAKKFIEEAVSGARINNAGDKSKNGENVLAYILYEAGIYHRLGDQLGVAAEYFQEAQQLVHNNNLKKMIGFQLELLRLTGQSNPDLDYIAHLVDEFKKRKLEQMYIIGLFELGQLQLRLENTKDAAASLKKAMDIAKKSELQFLLGLTTLTYGQTLVAISKYAKGLELYEEIQNHTQSFYLKALSHRYIAMVHFKRKDYDLAVDFSFNALNISLDHQVSALIPPACLFIGNLYEQYLNQPSKAKYFFKMGFDQSIGQVSDGLALSGARLEALQCYAEYLGRFFPGEAEEETPVHAFDFALRRPWQEIKDLFHYNLLIYYKMKTGVGSSLHQVLDLKKPTFYSIHFHLRKRGFYIPDFRRKSIQIPTENIIKPLQNYIQNLKETRWKEINKRFEKDIFLFLYQKYGYQKTNVAKVLKINYQVVRKKTAHIAQRGKGMPEALDS